MSRSFGRINRATEKLNDSAKSLGTSFSDADKTIAKFSGVVAAGLTLITVRAGYVEQALARLATVTNDSTQSVVTSIGNAEAAAREFSETWTASVTDSIKAQFELATAGVKVEEQILATQGAFKLAQATVGDFTNAARILGQFLNTFGRNAELNYLRPAERIEKITDILAQTVQRFQVTLPVLGEGFKFVVGPASELGLTLQETAVALGILNTAGFRGSIAGTALGNTLIRINKAAESLGLDPSKFTDAAGAVSSLTDFLDELNRSLEGLTPLERQNALIKTFEIRAGRVIGVLAKNTDQLKRFSAEFDLANGAAEKMATTVQTTLISEFRKLVNVLDNITTAMGKSVAGSIKGFIVFIKEIGVAIHDWIIEGNAVVGTLIKLVSTATAVTATLVGLKAALFGLVIAGTVIKASFLTLHSALKNIISIGLTALVLSFRSLVSIATIATSVFIRLASAFNATSKALVILKSVASPLKAIFTGIIAVVTYLAADMLLFGDSAEEATDKVRRIPEILKEIDKVAIGTSKQISGLAGEYKRLANAAAANSRNIIPVTQTVGESLGAKEYDRINKLEAERGNELGRTSGKIASQISILDNLSIKLKEIHTIGGFSDVIDSDAFVADGMKAFEFLDSIDTRFAQTGTNAQKQAEFLLKYSRAYALSIKEALGGTDEAAEAFEAITRQTSRLSEAFKQAPNNIGVIGRVLSELLDTVVQTSPEIAKLSSEAGRGFEKLLSRRDELSQLVGSLPSDLRETIAELQNFSNVDINLEDLLKGNTGDLREKIESDFTKRMVKFQVDMNPRLDVKEIEDIRKTISDSASKKIDFIINNSKALSAYREVIAEVNKLEQETKKIAQPLVIPNLLLEEIDKTVETIRNSIGGVENALKKLDINSSAKQFEEVDRRAAAFNAEIDKIPGKIEKAKEIIQSLQRIMISRLEIDPGDRSVNTLIEKIEAARKSIRSLQDTRTDAIIKSQESAFEIASKKLDQVLFGFDEGLGLIQRKNIQKLGTDLKGVIFQSLTGGLEEADIGKAIRDQFRKGFVENISDQVSKLAAGQLDPTGSIVQQFNSALLKAAPEIRGKLIEAAFSGDSENVKRILIDLLDQSGIAQELKSKGIDISNIFDFGKGFDETRQKLRDFGNDARIAMLTADSATQGYIRRLLEIKNAITPESIQSSIGSIEDLIRDAARRGIDIPGAERILKELLDQENNVQSPSQVISGAADNIGQSTTQVAQSLTAFSNTFAPLSTIIDGLNSTFTRFMDFIGGSKEATEKSISEGVNFNLSTGDRNININVNATGGSSTSITDFISETEAREIVERVTSELENELRADMRELEDRLRGR